MRDDVAFMLLKWYFWKVCLHYKTDIICIVSPDVDCESVRVFCTGPQPGSFAVQNRLLAGGRAPWEFWYPGLEGVSSNQSMYIALNIGLSALTTYFLNLGLASTLCLHGRYNLFKPFNCYFVWPFLVLNSRYHLIYFYFELLVEFG